ALVFNDLKERKQYLEHEFRLQYPELTVKNPQAPASPPPIESQPKAEPTSLEDKEIDEDSKYKEKVSEGISKNEAARLIRDLKNRQNKLESDFKEFIIDAVYKPSSFKKDFVSFWELSYWGKA